MNKKYVVDEVHGLYQIISLPVLRQTSGVIFDEVPPGLFPKIDAIDRVIHENGATSPGRVGDVARPWYLHAHQADHLLVLHGYRKVDLYSVAHGKVERFEVHSDLIKKNGKMLYRGSCILKWPRNVFHRVMSSAKHGSASINFAVHYKGFDIRENFSIYDLDIKTGKHRVIREGHLDQPRPGV